MTNEAVNNNSTDEALKVGAGQNIQENNENADAAKAAEAKAAEETKAKAEADSKAKQEAESKAKADADSKNKVPEKYDLKVPEGVNFDAKAVEEIASFAKERGFSNDDAQALLEREVKQKESFQKNAEVELQETTAKWAESAKADKEIGGEEFTRNAELAKRVVDRFGTPEFKQSLNKTGFGNYPELIRVFTRIGKAMSNDQLVLPGSQANQKVDVASKFYGDKNNKE